MSIERTYLELCTFHTFGERFDYLRLEGCVGQDTFGFDRVFAQQFYMSREWARIRDFVISRDNGNDLGLDGCPISGRILVHHMNPITLTDIREATDYLLNPDYMVCVSHATHNAIHYGGARPTMYDDIVERRSGDTRLW